MAESPDLSNAIEQLQQMLSSDDGQSQIQNILDMFSSESTDNSAESAPPPNGDGIDFDTVMKISSVMQAMNSTNDNPKTAFLQALKPFLKESRRTKLEQASKLIKIASVLKAFRQDSKGGV